MRSCFSYKNCISVDVTKCPLYDLQVSSEWDGTKALLMDGTLFTER